jgi:6-phosphogluconolactonase/glucosamine-6-phosphate isomerase/deaminase
VAVDTVIAHAERSLGGNVFGIPPTAVTLGTSELHAARRILLYSDDGLKQTIPRILLFAEPTVSYPVTLVQETPTCTWSRPPRRPPLPRRSGDRHTRVHGGGRPPCP